MKNRLYILIRWLYYVLLSFFNIILPKNNNKVFFEDLNCIRDNHYILYRYMLEKGYNEYTIVYYTLKKNNVMKKENVKIVNNFVLATFHYLTSRVIFFSYGANRFQCVPTKKQMVINLTHGMPAKKFGYCLNEKSAYPEEKCYTHVIIASPFFKDAFRKAWHCSEEQFVVAGAPRIDLLFQSVSEEKIVKLLGKRFDNHVVFLPTFRNSDSLGVHKHACEFPVISENNIAELNSFLCRMNTCLIVKLHHAQAELEIASSEYSNVKFLLNSDLQRYDIALYSLLGYSDALISDYSSVYIDYLLLNKPVGFVLDDLEEYKKTRGFLMEPIENYLPGAHIYTISDFVSFINDVIIKDDAYAEKRKEINMLFNTYKRSNNCENILQIAGIKK